MIRRLPSRQIHLDFHTSEHIEGIGKDFDKKQFQQALKIGNVNSVTVFAKCHHGYCYYPSEVAAAHPHLKEGLDLTGSMMDACHEIGVFAPIYITLGWSQKDAADHPEWIVKDKEGNYGTHNYDLNAKDLDPRPECSWLHLCSAGGYRQHLYDITKEICTRYNRVDGIFFDIMFMYESCYCQSCREGMIKMGYDLENESDARKYYEHKKHETMMGLNDIIIKHHPDATIFYNSGGAEINMPQWHYANTHFELEDLPTTWGGYDKMPIRAKYFSRKRKDYLGMTGKFHRSWGEFGGFKTPAALKYEFASLCTYGARISTGDQMHPTGLMDLETYRIIGDGYRYVESIEDYCYDVEETSNLGVIISKDLEVNEGIAKLLLDSHIDFDIVHSPNDLDRFDAVILPDETRLNNEWAMSLKMFIDKGKSVLFLGGSGLDEDGRGFALDIGLTYKGKSDYDMDFILAKDTISQGLVKSPFLCYDSAHLVEGRGEMLAALRNPYFSRTYGKYCSHYNTPYKLEDTCYPAVIKNNNIVYFAHQLAKMYKDYGVTFHRILFNNALKLIYDNPIVEVDMPSAGRIRFVDQKDNNRYILHLLYGNPIQRGGVSVIEDLPEIHDVQIKIRTDRQVKKVYSVPQMEEIPYKTGNGEINIIFPKFSCHQIIAISY